MSGDSKGHRAALWWKLQLSDRNNAAARALSAKLRRASPVAALCEPSVIDLARQLEVRPEHAANLARLVTLLAEIREDGSGSLAKALGGTEPVLSNLRFERLLRAKDAEHAALLRRAIIMADRRCNVAQLANDFLYWGEKTRIKWCFEYFGAEAPQVDLGERTS